MSDPWASSRATVVAVSAAGAPVTCKVFRSFVGALYAAYKLAGSKAALAVIDPEREIHVAGDRAAAVWQRSNFPEWTVGDPGLRLPGDWWLCTELTAPRMAPEFADAMRDAGNWAAREHAGSIARAFAGAEAAP